MNLKYRNRLFNSLASRMQFWWRYRRLHLLAIGLVMLVIVLVLFILPGQFQRDLPSPTPAQMFPLPLSKAQRVLVVAPHPDDETIGAAGVIQAALAQGSQVRVVIVTNGDGQALSPLVIHRSLEMGAEEYIQMGEQRQQESLAAMQKLGLPARDVIFLSFPDRGMLPLWNGNWTEDCPLRSSYTGAISSPYPLTFNPNARYCGRSVLNDFSAILANFHPDLIILPHPADKHPDHRASSNFALLAAVELNTRQPDYRPEVWGYLVHYADFPEVSDEKIAPPIQPPAALSGPDTRWASLTLTPGQAQYKNVALRAYTTQQTLLGKLLNSFANRDEIFARLPLTAPMRTNP
jgi:LmbE family N-acetylglucosaminyl deacetylase